MTLTNTTPWDVMMAACSNANDAIIVAPYIKVAVLEQVLDRITPGAHITCVSRWTPQDIIAGTTDLDCRTLAQARNGTFLLHSGLHAKYYRFDDRVLIGSANLTGAGMNLTNHGNLEILCPPPYQFNAEQFESDLMYKAYPVSDKEFDLWYRIALKQPHVEQTKVTEQLDYGSWKPITRRPEYIRLVYQQKAGEIPSDEQRRLAEVETAMLNIPNGLDESGFINWIKASMLSSQFVNDVLKAICQPRAIAWEIISEQWNMSKHEADQSITTTEYWIEFFELHSITER